MIQLTVNRVATPFTLHSPLRLPYKVHFLAGLCPLIRIHIRVYVELQKNG